MGSPRAKCVPSLNLQTQQSCGHTGVQVTEKRHQCPRNLCSRHKVITGTVLTIAVGRGSGMGSQVRYTGETGWLLNISAANKHKCCQGDIVNTVFLSTSVQSYIQVLVHRSEYTYNLLEIELLLKVNGNLVTPFESEEIVSVRLDVDN